MRWFLYQTICMLANITLVWRNYCNKIKKQLVVVTSVVTVGGSQGLIWVTRRMASGTTGQ